MSREEREDQLFHEIGQLRVVVHEQAATIQGFVNEIQRMKVHRDRCPLCRAANQPNPRDGENGVRSQEIPEGSVRG